MAYSPHPEPPADLPSRALPITVWARPVWRCYRLDLGPVWFGAGRQWRWDCPGGSYGVLYAAADEAGAFLETFGHTTGERLVAAADIARRGLARLGVEGPPALVDLTGDGLVQVGADARLFTGDYALAQRWSAAFFAHPARVDGVLYPSRHHPRLGCVALYDRARERVRVEAEAPWLGAHRATLGVLLDRFGFGLL